MAILPISEKYNDYAREVKTFFDKAGVRALIDDRNEKIGRKIRDAQMEKVPYMVVVGDRDMEAGTVSVRTRGGEDLGAMPLADFAAKLHEIVDSLAIQ